MQKSNLGIIIFALFFSMITAITIFFILAPLYSGQSEKLTTLQKEIIITRFVNKSDYKGKWDLEKEFPQRIRTALIKEGYLIPSIIEKHNRTTLLRLISDSGPMGIIRGEIKEFSLATQLFSFGPFKYKVDTARIDLDLEIIKEGEVITEFCTQKEEDKKINYVLFGGAMEDTQDIEITDFEFGSSLFEQSIAGKATRKIVQECVEKIKKHLIP